MSTNNNDFFADDSREVPDKEEVREKVTMGAVVTYLGLKWNEAHDKVQCPFHDDGDPSMQVNKSTVFCYSCKRTWDVYQFLMDYLHIDFAEAFNWLVENAESYSKLTTKQYAPKKSEYRGPAPLEIVNYYIGCLKPEHRMWLREERLLTDETIDRAGIGWKNELKAYTLPFWRGIPHQSEVDIVQYRSTKDSPLIHGETWRYIGMKHHNRPSILNSHRFSKGVTITHYGSFDGLLMEQDGLAAGSINGSSVFLREENLPRLRSHYCPGATNIFIPDMVSSEVEPAYRTAMNVPGGLVKHYPPEWEWYDEQGKRGKDYTNWRQSGKTVWDFIYEVIMRNNNTLILLPNKQEQEYIDRILNHMSQGEWENVETYLAIFEPEHTAKVITHSLMLKAQHDPYDTFTGDEWAEFRVELETAWKSYFDLATVVKRWSMLAYDRMGGF